MRWSTGSGPFTAPAAAFSLLFLAFMLALSPSLAAQAASDAGTAVDFSHPGLPPLSRHGGIDISLGLLNFASGRGGLFISAGIPALAQLSLDIDVRGEGAGLHAALSTLVAALYLDIDANGLGIQLDTLLGSGIQLRTGLPFVSHGGIDVWLFGSGLHLGTDSLYAWSYRGGGGLDFTRGEAFALSRSPVFKARFFGAYGGPGFQGFAMIGAPVVSLRFRGEATAASLNPGRPGFTERPRDAVDASYRLHDIQFIGAGGPYSWSWGQENDQALAAEIRRTAPLWWFDPFALSKALLTLAVWG